MSKELDNTNVIKEETPKKRGRKPKKNKYFAEEQERAFVEYLTCDNEHQKNKIFNAEVYPALCKMIECLIRRYYLFSVDESYEDTFNDTLSFLMTKIKNFQPEKGKKAYSYCGTVCKRFLIMKRTNSIKKRDTCLSYESVFSTPEKDNREYKEFILETFHDKLINQTKKEIQCMLDKGKTEKRKLTTNEVKVGKALIEVLDHWEDMIDDERSRKFTKISLLYFLKEYTFCTTTEVRNAMKIYKKLYLFTKQDLLKE